MKIVLFNSVHFRRITILFSILLLSGCLFAPKREVTTYDLGLPKNIPLKRVNINVLPFLNNSETSFQMVYRVDNYKIEYDVYNRWSNNPGKLVTYYLKNTFLNDFKSNAQGTVNYTLSGSVLAFEINMKDGFVVLSVNYSLSKDRKKILTKSKTYKIFFKKPSPRVFAASMALAVDEFAKDIVSELGVGRVEDNMLFSANESNNPFTV